MRRQVLVVGFLLGMVAGEVRAQTAKDAEKAFAASVVGQKLLLRDYSVESKRSYLWVDGSLESGVPLARTLGIFEASSVKWKSDRVEIQGQRTTMVKGEHGLASEGPSKMTLIIDVKGADPLVVAPKLKEQLFQSTMADAMSLVPAVYRDVLPYAFKKPVAPAPGDEGRKQYELKGCGPGLQTTPPRLLHSVDPSFSDEARGRKFSGMARMAITVDTSGHVVDPWVAIAAGTGLDEQASKAVVQYVFQPAKCDGIPKQTMIFIDVDFQIF